MPAPGLLPELQWGCLGQCLERTVGPPCPLAFAALLAGLEDPLSCAVLCTARAPPLLPPHLTLGLLTLRCPPFCILGLWQAWGCALRRLRRSHGTSHHLEKLGGGCLRIRQLQDCLQAGRGRVCAEVLADTLVDAFMPPRHGWVPLLWLLWLLRLLVAGKLRHTPEQRYAEHAVIRFCCAMDAHGLD